VVDLAAFISARLSEDEAMAYGLCGNGLHLARWVVSGDSIFVGTEPRPEQPIAHARDERVRQHIARHDPARVLREVTAKRAIVARYGEPLAGLGNLGDQLQLSQEKTGLWFAVRELAAVWSDHPDYRAEWAPGHG
jgi:hypothetical protein